MARVQQVDEITRSLTKPRKMCYIQNIHTCQCLGKLDAAFTPQDVRSCPCPTIVRMHGLRHKCEHCRRQQKRGRKKTTTTTQGTASSGVSTQTPSGQLTRRGAETVDMQHTTRVLDDPQAQPAEVRRTGCHKLYGSPRDAFEKQGRDRTNGFNIFTSSTWNAGRSRGAPRIGRLILAGEADVMNVDHTHCEHINGQSRQQIVDKIEELLGQLYGMKLAGLVFQTSII